MPKPLENPVNAEELRDVVNLVQRTISLNAPLTPGLIVSGTQFDGDYLLQETLINDRPWFAVGLYRIQAQSDGRYTINTSTPGLNYWISNTGYSDPYDINGWLPVGSPIGDPVVKKIFGLTIESEAGRQADYQDRKWIKNIGSGWSEIKIINDNKLLVKYINSDFNLSSYLNSNYFMIGGGGVYCSIDYDSDFKVGHKVEFYCAGSDFDLIPASDVVIISPGIYQIVTNQKMELVLISDSGNIQTWTSIISGQAGA